MTRRHLLALFFIGSTGCAGTSSNNDADNGQSLLQKALDAWKSGNSPSQLASESPPVKVSDYRWETGFKLTKFEIATTPSKSGFDLRFPVDLWLTPPKGKPIREKAFYTVVTSPSITVIRDPES
jgi:hypothetical protein